VVKEPTRRDVLLDLVLTKKDWLRMCRLGAALAALTMRQWSSGSRMKEAGQQGRSQPWES